jgi:SM-20-related protein
MPQSEHSDLDLYVVRDFFDAETCSDLIAEMRAAQTCAALTYGQESLGVINDRIRKVSRVQPSRKTLTRVTERLMDFREMIGRHFGATLHHCEEPQFLCYRPGDFFVAHQDGKTGLVRLESDESRSISMSLFLNRQSETPESEAYCGGSLVFSDWRHDRNCSVQGETGKLIAFRSETTHEVVPITHGERYSIVTWYG